MNRFRPNIVVTDCAAAAEDGWIEYGIGKDVIVESVKPCDRCPVGACSILRLHDSVHDHNLHITCTIMRAALVRDPALMQPCCILHAVRALTGPSGVHTHRHSGASATCRPFYCTPGLHISRSWETCKPFPCIGSWQPYLLGNDASLVSSRAVELVMYRLCVTLTWLI